MLFFLWNLQHPHTAVQGRGDKCTVSQGHVSTSQLSDHTPPVRKRCREQQARTELLSVSWTSVLSSPVLHKTSGLLLLSQHSVLQTA